MCWCTPEMRTPNCGRIGCHPPRPKIDWPKIWKDFDNMAARGIGTLNEVRIEELVEKQLKGEE